MVVVMKVNHTKKQRESTQYKNADSYLSAENLEIKIILETLHQYDNAERNYFRAEEMVYFENITN